MDEDTSTIIKRVRVPKKNIPKKVRIPKKHKRQYIVIDIHDKTSMIQNNIEHYFYNLYLLSIILFIDICIYAINTICKQNTDIFSNIRYSIHNYINIYMGLEFAWTVFYIYYISSILYDKKYKILYYLQILYNILSLGLLSYTYISNINTITTYDIFIECLFLSRFSTLCFTRIT